MREVGDGIIAKISFCVILSYTYLPIRFYPHKAFANFPKQKFLKEAIDLITFTHVSAIMFIF